MKKRLALLAVISLALFMGSWFDGHGGAKAVAYNCNDVYYTNLTSYGSGEKIVIDVFNEGTTGASGLSIGGQSWYRVSKTDYPDHTSSIFKPQITQARGLYNVHVAIGPNGYLCTNPDGQFRIQ